jgi:DNA repair protein RadC
LNRIIHTCRLQKVQGTACSIRACPPSPLPKDPPAAAEEPHYYGRRERLRERFYSAGPGALSDYELLEMALFAAIPRRDTKPLAKVLLKKFGTFAEVIHAPEARLREVDGIKDGSVNQLKLIAAAAGRIATGEIKRSIALTSWHEVIDYCRAPAWRSPTRSSFATCFSTRRTS